MANIRKLEQQARQVTRCEGCNLPIKQYQGTDYWYASTEANSFDVVCNRIGYHHPKGK